MPNYLTVCEKAARQGGDVLLQWKGRAAVYEKNRRDLVTEADLASQRVIRQVVLEAFPHHAFLGEEADAEEHNSLGDLSHQGGFRWIVDPLDGTTNYVHQLRSYAVSVALEHNGEIVVGAVFDPELDEMYLAEKGKGAFLNGQRIRPSDCREMEQALVAASLPAHLPRGSAEITRLIEVIHAAQAIRRLGSAALNLCYLAQGRLDAYWATSVKIWDVAAGMLIVREAGAIMTSLAGGAVDVNRPFFAAAATPELHAELLQVLSRASQ